jgi:tRNA U34 5-methylaminomethyl-2-thiouridine-forming methyltransferase MnmC
MKKGGKLATYSCARVVRENLVAAGFSVSDGPCVGRRAPGTVAVK